MIATEMAPMIDPTITVRDVSGHFVSVTVGVDDEVDYRDGDDDASESLGGGVISSPESSLPLPATTSSAALASCCSS